MKTDAIEVKSKPTLSLYDLEGAAPSVKVGDNVTVIVTGKITEVGSSKGYGKDKAVTHRISVERLSVKILGEKDIPDDDISDMSDEDIKQHLKEAKSK